MKRIQRWMPCILVAALGLSLLLCGILRTGAASLLKATFTPLEGDESVWKGITLAGNTGMLQNGVRFTLTDGEVKTDVSLDRTNWRESSWNGTSNKPSVAVKWTIGEAERDRAYQQAQLLNEGYGSYLQTKASRVSYIATVRLPDGSGLRLDTGTQTELPRAITWQSGKFDPENPENPVSGFSTSYAFEGPTADSAESQSFLQEHQWLYRVPNACTAVLPLKDAYYFCVTTPGPEGRAFLYRVDSTLTAKEIAEKTTQTISTGGTQVTIEDNTVPYGSATKLWEQPAGSRILWASVWQDDRFAMVVQGVVDGKQTVRIVLLDTQGNELSSAVLPIALDAAAECQVQSFLSREKNELAFTIFETVQVGVDAVTDEQVVRLHAACRVQDGVIETIITASPDAEEAKAFQRERGFATDANILVALNDAGTRLICASKSATEERVTCKYEYGEKEEAYFANDGVLLEVYEPNATRPIARGRLACGEKNNALLVSSYSLPLGGVNRPASTRIQISLFARIGAPNYTFEGISTAMWSLGYYDADGGYVYFAY